jgi:hypothetical protein
MSRRPEIRKTRKWRTLGVLFALSLLATGCASAAIAGGVVVVIGVAVALTADCEEGIGVTVWDPSMSHSVCDATVIASKGDKHVSFSPCFAGYLGEGEWTVTAQREGYETAVGTVTVAHDHKCREPVYHSLELTLRPLRSAIPARAPGPYSAQPYLPYPTQPPPGAGPPPSAPPPASSPPPAPAPSPSESSPAPTSPAPAPTTSSVPTGAFPLAPETR